MTSPTASDTNAPPPGSPQASPAPPASCPPRAFAQGTGLLLQTVGVFLILCTCCIFSSSFLWNPIRTPAEAIGHTAPDVHVSQNQSWGTLGKLFTDPGKTGFALMVFGMMIGGLALATFGLGLQADHRHAALGATISCLILLGVLTLAGLGLWRGPSTPATRLGHAVISLLIVGVTFFCLSAWRQVKRHPPPANIDIIPPGAKIPYSMYHDDPPEVRLKKQLQARRLQLQAEQEELDRLEQELDCQEKHDAS